MAPIQDALSQAGVTIPSFQFSFITGEFMIYALFGILGAMLVGGIFIFLYLQLLFNKKILLFRKIGNIVLPAAADRAKFERIGLAGDYWMKTKKFKKYLPRPKLQMGKNVYWYFEREDGEWINFTIGDIDEMIKQADIKYIDEDMRLQRLGIQRNLKDRFDKISWWSKYGNALMGVVFMIIVTICLVILFNNIKELVSALPKLANALQGVADAMRDVAREPSLIPINNTG